MFLEALESRVMLSSAAHVFANYDGQIVSAGGSERIDFGISNSEFALSGGKTNLGFQLVAGDGGNLDPAAVTIRNSSTNAVITPALSRPDLAANRQSLVVAELPLGSYYLTVSAEHNTSGAYRLNTYLVGDINGDRKVDTADGIAINTLIKTSQYQVEADANLDGVVTAYDYSQWRTNLGDSTTLKPLSVTIAAVPGSVVLPDGTRATNQSTVSVAGISGSGASLAIETGADNRFDNGSGIAGTAGAFSISGVPLQAEGTNTVRVRSRAASQFTQQLLDSFSITLDTHVPVVVVDTPASGVATNRNVTVSGRITDDRTGVATLKGQLDSGPMFDVTFDAMGVFHFATALPLDGTADGPHIIHLRGTDRVGNVSSAYDAPFTLDTRAPTVIVDSPTQGTVTNRNVIVAGRVNDERTGVARLQARVDGGALFDVFFDPHGAFSFPTTLPLDGTDDGSHTVELQGTDQAGNVSSFFDIDFTLDSSPPSATFDLSIGSDTGIIGDRQTEAGRVTLIGTTEPGAQVTLLAGGATTGPTTVAQSNGTFEFYSVNLALGRNDFTVVASDAVGNSSRTTHTFTRLASTGQADPVLDWNHQALEAIRLDAGNPPKSSRSLAIVQAAILDVVNAIEGTPAQFVAIPTAPGTSLVAAIAAAGHRSLEYLYPAQQAAFDTALATSLAAVPDGSAKTNGIALGNAIADAMLNLRKNDGSLAFVDYQGGDAPGQWRPTAPMYDVAIVPQWGDVQPFAISSTAGFFPDGPPDMSSQAWADAFNQVKDLGSATSTTRTDEQTKIARFWADGAGTYMPPGHWNQIANIAAQSVGNSVAENARLLGRLDAALADAAIVAWDVKFTDGFWRPITAIREGGTDGNSQTMADPNWTPLLTTPAFPEYVSGHSTFSGAAAAILNASFGDNFSFTVGSFTAANLVRSFTSFDQAAEEASFSRILGGIHYSFSGEDGLAVGRKIGAAVLEAYTSTTDTRAPAIVLDAIPVASASNFDIHGQILDNFAGLHSASVQRDGGTTVALNLDGLGRFTLGTGLATDGSADGAHVFHFAATDAAGNTGTYDLSFTLDTRAPVLNVASPAESDNLDDTSRLTGSADGTGSAIARLTYTFDGAGEVPVSTGANGAFDVLLDVSKLGAGSHVLVVTATDAAGNVTQVTRHVSLTDTTRFLVSTVSPADGALDVGVTFRPQVFFTRPVDPATLNSHNLYATFGGQKLAATIVPSNDGKFAWLFFAQPLPDSSRIRITVDGSTIAPAGGSAALDADNDGTPGGVLTYDFTTVSVAGVQGTSLFGTLADPWLDLKPGSFDDVRPGPDSVLMTADDVYLHPIEHVKVYITGREDQAVYTDAAGHFDLTDIPAGDIKLVLDGLTAVSPDGVYFPEMVMDLQVVPGSRNTVMGAMPSDPNQPRSLTEPGVYLPRLQNSILHDVPANQTTTIGVDATAAPNLTPEQRALLTIGVQANSLTGSDGRALDSAQIGISTVPAELVRDMLPPGVLQHTFDITVQALGVSTFSQPAPMTFPNVFGAAPGSQLNFLSFDHTTGRLVIEGTATVSADGLSVTTDPGTGVTHPGWHGLTPPGGCGGSGGPPPQGPTPPQPGEMVEEHTPVALNFITGDTGATNFMTRTWMSPPENPNVPSLPPIPGCEVPPHHDGLQQPFKNVTIEIDGVLEKFMKPIAGGLPLVGQSFTLSAGTNETKKFGFETKPYAEVFPSNGFRDLLKDQLYGAKIKITVIEQQADGTRKRDIYTYYQYRWVDVIDANEAQNKTGATAAFIKTFTDGFERNKFIDAHLPSSVTTSYGSAAPFMVNDPGTGEFLTLWKFDPSSVGNASEKVTIKVSDAMLPGGGKVGEVTATGKGIGKTKLSVNLDDADGYKVELKRVLLSLSDAYRPGPDNKPGVAGVDDDGIGGIDNPTEFGYPGSDDTFATLYDHSGGMPSVTLITGADGKPGVAGVDDDAANGVDDAGELGFAGSDDRKVNYYATNASKRVVSARFKTLFAGFLPSDRAGTGADAVLGTPDDQFTAAQITAMNTRVDNEADDLYMEVATDFAAISSAITFQRTNAGADVVMDWKELGAGLFGSTSHYDSNYAKNTELIGTFGRTDPVTSNTFTKETPAGAQQWALAQYINGDLADTGHFAVGINVNLSNATITFAQYVANTVSHELAHTYGLKEGYLPSGGPTGGTAMINSNGNAPPFDIMSNGQSGDPDMKFESPTDDILRAAAGLASNFNDGLKDALKKWRDQFNLQNGLDNKDGIREESPQPSTSGELTLTLDALHYFFGDNAAPAVLGRIGADGAGHQTLTSDFVLTNEGYGPLTISSVSLDSGSRGFTVLDTGLVGVTLAVGETRRLTVQFDPARVGSESDVLVIHSDAGYAPTFRQALQADAISATPLVHATAGQNDLGGVFISGGTSQRSNVATIRNDGAQPLIVSGFSLADGRGRFTFLGIPGDLATSPISLDYGRSFSFGVSFDPDHMGLDRALIDILTNDPLHPVTRVSVVGTGLAENVYPQWGNDFQAIDTPDLAGSDTLRTVSDNNGNFSFFLPPQQLYHYSSFDPDTGLIGHSYGTTPQSGRGIDLTSSIVFGASTAPDTDFDGLPDDIEHAIGTFLDKTDTNSDGIDDYTAIQQGIDPLGDTALPIGIIGTVKPQGTFFVQDVVASSDTAYLAAGAGGMQVVDITKITKPAVIASVPAATLGGNAVAVAFTSIPGATAGTIRNLVAVALGSQGLAIVDVTDPPAAHLVTRIPVPGSAQSVEIVDNLAYVGGSGGLVSVLDMKTGELVSTFTATGSGDVTAVKFSAGTLYTLRGGTLASYDLARNLAVPPLRSSIAFGGATHLFVGSDRAYVTGSQVFEAIDITNPSNLRNTSGARPALNYLGLAANGSGRLIVSETATFGGNGDARVGLFNVQNPDDTNGFLTEFDTPGSVQDVWIQNGLGLIADGAGGFAIFNYLGFDQGSTPPTITVSTTSPDGVSAIEGSHMRVDVTTFDDVQTRRVNLVANGVSLEPDGSFPFSFFVDVQTLASGATTLTLEVTATDTGGNESTVIREFAIVRDTVAPSLLSVLPADDKIQFNSIQALRATFSEPLDLTTLSASSIHVVEAGADGHLGTSDDVVMPLSSFDFRLSVNLLTVTPTVPLGPGNYELQLDRAEITDRAGNPLGTGVFRSQFTVQSIPFNAVINGAIDSPGEIDLYSFQAMPGDEVTLFADWNPGGINLSQGQISLLAPDGVTVLASGEGAGSAQLSDVLLPTAGLYTVRIRSASTQALGQGAYRFTISDPETASETIGFGQTLTRSIAVRGDDHEWQFDATAGNLINFSYVGPELEGGIRIFNPDGTEFARLDGGTTIVLFATPAIQTGMYHFTIDDDNSTGPYTIQLDEGNFADEVPGRFNAVQGGNLTRLYDIDRFRYTLAAGDEITVYGNLTGVGAGTIRVLDAVTGVELTPSKSGSDPQITNFVSNVARDVLVDVRGVSGSSFHPGSYTLTVSDPETNAETLSFGGTVSRSIAVRGDDQEWQFDASGVEVVTLAYRGPSLDSGITIKRPDGTTLVHLPGGGAIIGRDLHLDQPGTYRFILADDDATGSYTLTLSDPTIHYETLAFGAAETRSIDILGNDQEWQIVAAGGEVVTLGYRGPRLESGITIKRPDGTTLANLPAGSTIVGRDLRLNQPGMYQFVLSDEATTGSYTLNLSNPADIESPGVPLTANTARTDAIGTIFDVDVFTFNAAAGVAFSLLAEWQPGGSGLGMGEIELINPSGLVVATSSGSGANSIAVESAVTGTYLVRVRAAVDNDFATGAYRLTAYRGAEVPMNDTLGTAVITGIATPALTHYQSTGFIGDNIHGVRDVDLYQVHSLRGDQIVVDIHAKTVGSDLNSFVRLFNSAGAILSTNDDSGGSSDSYLTYTVLDDGLYTIGVSSNGNTSYDASTAGRGAAGSVGNYTIVLDVAKDFTGPKVTSISPTGVSTAEDHTRFVVDFNERLNAATANDASNYILVSAGSDAIFGTSDDRTIALRANYDESQRRVTLTTVDGPDAGNDPDPLARGFTYRLTLSSSSGITDIAGNPLNDGQDEVAFLELVESVGTPSTVFPLVDGFETGSLASYWTTTTSGGARVQVTNQNAPIHAGTYHVRMDNPGETGRATMILLADLTGLDPNADVDLRFYHRDNGDGNESMPNNFAGRVNSDGVAFSVDGVNWHRLVELGASTENPYSPFIVDLDGALRGAGLPINSQVQILFQHYLGSGQSAFFDDIELAPDLAGPTVVGVSTPGPLVFSSSLSSITVDFSESLDDLTANASTSYELRRTDTNALVAVTPSYDDSTRRVRLTTGVLAQAPYRLTVRGDSSVGGITVVRDANGNALNNGADSVFRFELFALEGTPNDETRDATLTAMNTGGSFNVTTAIGNNVYGGRDVDLYEFQAGAGDRLTVTTTSNDFGVPPGFNTLLRLFDASGNQLASNDDLAGFDTDSQIQNFQIPSNGTYYIGVSSSSNTTYNPLIAPTGTSGPQGKYRLDMNLVDDTTPPSVTKVVPHSGPNENQSIDKIDITFSEALSLASATNPANYTLLGLGANHAVGGGDDSPYLFTVAYNPETFVMTLTLTSPESLLPLPQGAYRLIVKGASSGITDIAGNRLNSGVDVISDFRVISPETPLNDRLSDAVNTGILADGGTFTADGAIGDNAFEARDVDLYRFQAREGLRLTVSLNDQSIDSPLSARVRLFYEAGVELTASEAYYSDDVFTFDITAAGTYYVGVSGSGNYYYNPVSPGSGPAASTTGEYVVSISTSDVIAPTVDNLLPAQIAVGGHVRQITAHFSEPMDVTAAESTASYQLLYSGPDRRFGTGDERALSFTAFYNVGTHDVVLTTTDPIPNGDVRLTLLSSHLVDRAGLHLGSGVNFVQTIEVVTTGAPVTVLEPLDAAPLGAEWLLVQPDANAQAQVTSTGVPRLGTGHLRLGNISNYQTTTSTAILAVQPNGQSPLTLSFHNKQGIYSWQYTLPESFEGQTAGDGVAISVDGNQWYRVSDFTSQAVGEYSRFVVDLSAEAALHGLSLAGPLLVRFSNTEYYSGAEYSDFIDDVRVAVGPATPVATGVVPSSFISNAAPNSFGVTFSDDLQAAAAVNPANYQLVRAGADHLLGTADDVSVGVAANVLSYSAASDTLTFTFANPLPNDAYRVTILPTLVNPAGEAINDGLQQAFTFDVAATEPATNDTQSTATSTGIVRTTDGQFATVGAVGNNTYGGRDVDLYALESGNGERLAVNLTRFGASNADVRVRVFNSAGMELGAAVTTSTNASVPVVLFLNTNETIYVGVSASANSNYNPATPGSGSVGAQGLYALSIETRGGVAVPPLSEGFEDPALPPYFVTYAPDASGLVSSSTNRAHGGSRSLLLGDTDYSYTLVEATMTVDATALPHTDLSFQAQAAYYDYYYYTNPLNPAGGHYTNHFNGDGVAFSVDGTTWYPLVNFAGAFSGPNTWSRFEVDLNAAAAAAGVTLTSTTRIRFQNYAVGETPNNSFYYGLYIDDIRVDNDQISPKVLTATGIDQFEVTSTLTAPTVQFNESLDAATAELASNYQFRSDGLDNLFDTADDVIYVVVPVYDDVTHATTLELSDVNVGLAPDTYRLRLIGTGATALRDTNGNLINDGADRDVVFAVFPHEGTINNTIATAMATGLISAGGVFSTSAMLGNDGLASAATFDDEDLYRIDIVANESLYLRGTSRFGNPNLRMRLFDSAGTQVTFLDPSGNNLLLDGFKLPATGTYYIGISDSSNDAYNPTTGSGDTGLSRGIYDLDIQFVQPASFPFTDGFESGILDGARWDVFGHDFGYGPGVARVEPTSPAPLAGSYSVVLSNPSYPGQSKTDLTLHIDLAGQSNVELRFKERNNYDYYYGGSVSQYDGRYPGGSQDGVFLSVDGSSFYRIPNVFNGPPGQGIFDRVVDLDEFATLNGLTLSADTQIRFEADHYYSDYALQGRQIDDVSIATDTFGPRLTQLTTDGGTTATTRVSDSVTQFVATFDDRLNTTRANDGGAYQLLYAGADGLFSGEAGDTGDDAAITATPTYDGNFDVTISVDSAQRPLQPGRYRVVFHGTGSAILTDHEGNVLNNGADEVREYTLVDSGPRVVSTSPTTNSTVTPAAGLSTVVVTFSEDVLASSFDGNDVIIRDEGGVVVVSPADISVTGAGTVWTIAFPTIHGPGQYSVQIGQHVTDLVGHEMNQDNDFFNGENYSDWYTLNVRVTDSGSTTLYDQASNRWDISPYDGDINDGGRINPATGALTHSDSYDGMYYLQIDGSYYYSSSSSFRFDDGGRTVTTADRLINGLRTHREIYVPTDDEFARFIDVLQNPGAETITRRVMLHGNLGSDNATVITASGSGDLLFDPSDNYLATDDDDGTWDLSLSHVLMDGRHARLATANRSGDNLYWSFDVTVAPGQTVRLMTFAVQELNRAASQAQATRLVGLPATALANLTDEEKGSIINFDTGRDTIAPVVASIDPVPGIYFEGTINQFTVTFSEPMNAASANDAGNYRFVNVGDDGELGTADDVEIALTPNYDDVNRQVVLSIDASLLPLPKGDYRLILNGTTGLSDKAGNLLNSGSDQVDQFNIVVQGPSVVGFDSGFPNSSSGWSEFVVTFDQEIDADSFTGFDVLISGPYGNFVPQDQIVITENGSLTSWIVSIPTQYILGTYYVSIGPDILNLFGQPMDQDGDTINGEPSEDVYLASLGVVSPSFGPYVTDFLAGDTNSNPGWSEFTVTFDHDISYFDQYGVQIYSYSTGQWFDQNQFTVNGSGNVWTVDFPAIKTAGYYYVQIGPYIYDYYGEPMNQNFNSFNGEYDDAYSTVVTVGDQLNLGGQTLLDPHAAILSATQLQPIVAEAFARWSAAGVSADQIQSLGDIQFEIRDLTGTQLGLATPGQIWIDANAAGQGWFVDMTPSLNEEFVGMSHQAVGGSIAASLVDLLSVVMHELGHLLGFEHGTAGDVMDATLQPGVRHTSAVPEPVLHVSAERPSGEPRNLNSTSPMFSIPLVPIKGRPVSDPPIRWENIRSIQSVEEPGIPADARTSESNDIFWFKSVFNWQTLGRILNQWRRKA